MTQEPSTRLSHYIRIPDTNIRIDARKQSCNGLVSHEAKNALGMESNGRYFMPSPEPFMRFYNSLIAAEAGKITLRSGSNKPLRKQEVNGLYERFVLGKHGGVWTHLNARFVAGSGYHDLDMIADERMIPDGKGMRVSFARHPLEEHVDGHGIIVSTIFNSQGWPTRKSECAELQPGKNIFFWQPYEDSVAGFGADAGRALLSCGRDPQDSGSALGVFACAEGAPRRTK